MPASVNAAQSTSDLLAAFTASGMAKADLVKASGVSRRSIDRFVSGGNVSADTAEKIAAVLPAPETPAEAAAAEADAILAETQADVPSGEADASGLFVVAPGDKHAMMLRQNAAKAEHAAFVAWQKAGSKGDAPATPNFEAIKAVAANSTSLRKGSAKGGKSSTPRVTTDKSLRFGKVNEDGTRKGLSDQNNRFSDLAWNYTKGVNGDAPRIPAAELRALLAKNGITEPTTTEWTFKLSNGITIGAWKNA